MDPLSGGIERPSSEPGSPADERFAKRSLLETTLETDDDSDDLADATHTRLDTIVLETCTELIDSILFATVLLCDIVSNSEGRLNQKYSRTPDAKALIEEHPLGVVRKAERGME